MGSWKLEVVYQKFKMKELRIKNGKRIGIWGACRRYAIWVAQGFNRGFKELII